MDANNRFRLFVGACIRLLAGFILLASLLFASAGNLYWYAAWLLLALLFVPMLLMGIMMGVFAPRRLFGRLKMRETRPRQHTIVGFSGIVFVVMLVVSGLDYRYGWSSCSEFVTALSAVLLLLAYLLYIEVLRENKWSSRTVEVVENQRVVSDGLYGFVRHPMYASALLLFLTMPLVLGSWWGFAMSMFHIPLFVARILDEEQLLCQELCGYTTYCARVHWRLIPYIW